MTVKRKRRAVVFGTEAVEALEEGANLDAVIKWAESGQLEGAVTDLSDQTEDYIRGYTKALEDLEGWNQHEVVDLSEGE